MTMKSQGTKLYTIDPADDSVMLVGCITSLDGIDSTNEQIEITCLSDLARAFESGLASPGTASFGINFDDSDASHVRLHQLKTAGTTLKWAVGFSNGTADPAVDSAADFDLDTARGWLTFNGFMTSYPFAFAQNDVVKSTIGIQISGEPVLVPKSS